MKYTLLVDAWDAQGRVELVGGRYTVYATSAADARAYLTARLSFYGFNIYRVEPVRVSGAAS